jgi:hypothetical protein
MRRRGWTISRQNRTGIAHNAPALSEWSDDNNENRGLWPVGVEDTAEGSFLQPKQHTEPQILQGQGSNPTLSANSQTSEYKGLVALDPVSTASAKNLTRVIMGASGDAVSASEVHPRQRGPTQEVLVAFG